MTSLRELGESITGAVLDTVGRTAARLQERKPLPADLLESDNAFLVVIDAAGASAADVQVRFEDGAVFVRVDRFREYHEGYEMRYPGRGLSLDGNVALPSGAKVDADAASATVTKHGTLRIEIPKLGETAEDSVEIETSDSEE
jgi:HSP20 family protein